MTTKNPLEFCRVCCNRKFSKGQGLLCGLTGKKPDFEDTCPHYSEDAAAIESQKKKEESRKESVGISGFLAFFVYWSIPISTIVTLVTNIAVWSEYVALGTLGVLFGLSFLLFYCYFQFYIMYGFIKRKPDTVFIAKYQLIMIVMLNLWIVINGTANGTDMLSSISMLVSSIIWSIVFYVFLCRSEDVEAIIPKKERKVSWFNKMMIILSIVVPVCLVGGIALKNTRAVTPKQQLEAACIEGRKGLPVEILPGITYKDIYLKDNALVLDYAFDDAISEQYESLSSEFLKLAGLFSKENGIQKLSESKNEDPIFALASSAGCKIVYKYQSSSGKKLFSYSISPEEIRDVISKDYVYKTKIEDFKAILKAFNALLPIEYFNGGFLVKCLLSESGTELVYELELSESDSSALLELSEQYLKDYILDPEVFPYMTDAPHQLGLVNKLNFRYEFQADGNSWWKQTVHVTPEEYLPVLENVAATE